jgi:chlorite dismutase
VEDISDVKLDVREHGANQQTFDRRLFMQLQVYTGCADTKPIIAALEASHAECVLYLDACDPRGIGILTVTEDPTFFVSGLRELLGAPPFVDLTRRAEFAMLGRTYSSGFEPNLEDFLLRRPRRTIGNAACPWAVWYPLRRTGAFARLAPREQGVILREHGNIGRAYGDAGLAYDIRLACNGLDVNDNDFVVGLVGPDLYPLSHLVQTMRRTIQTSEYIERLGPFFIGRACWQHIAG